jgi:hypothetical protein
VCFLPFFAAAAFGAAILSVAVRAAIILSNQIKNVKNAM